MGLIEKDKIGSNDIYLVVFQLAQPASITATMAAQPPRGPRVKGGRPRGQPVPTPAAAPRTVPGNKRVLWTVAFAAVTIVGAIYGAGLKTQQEYKAVCLLPRGVPVLQG